MKLNLDFLKQLNNLRLNPVLFYEKNIEDYKNMINTKRLYQYHVKYILKYSNLNDLLFIN